eukprot:SAG31_NODE_998_length_10460_cov_255.143505_6_plen_65_part_00
MLPFGDELLEAAVTLDWVVLDAHVQERVALWCCLLVDLDPVLWPANQITVLLRDLPQLFLVWKR